MKQLTSEQLERLKPESREKYEKRLKAVKRNRRILAVVCTAAVVIAVGCALGMTVLFNITDITVSKPGAVYAAEEIINASGLNKGDNMVLTDFEQAASRIQTNLPYVLEADIAKSLSGKVTISIKDTSAAMLIEMKHGYAVADIRGKILETIEKKPENHNFIILKTRNSIDATPGMLFSFSSEQEGLVYNKLITELKNAGIYDNITLIDISDYTSVKVEYQNRLRILLGATDDLDVKLKGCIQVIKAEDEKDPALVAEINSKVAKKVYVNPIDSLHPEDEEDTTEPVTGADEGTTEPATDTGEGTTGQSEPVTDMSTENSEDTTSKTETTTEEASESTTQVSEENEEN